LSLDILLWAFLASYVVHLVDETTMNGGFVRWFQSSFWPTYTSRMNFWFNSGAVLAIAASNLLYDLLGGHWIILALIWPAGFALHGITLHLFWTVRQRNVSPGLATSVIYWIMAYFFLRYGFLAGQISAADFWLGTLIGVLTVGAFLTFVPTVVIPRLIRGRAQQGNLRT
jgi:Protein of unknown function with HXXEE motif